MNWFWKRIAFECDWNGFLSKSNVWILACRENLTSAVITLTGVGKCSAKTVYARETLLACSDKSLFLEGESTAIALTDDLRCWWNKRDWG